jgi:hypothetical protein
MVPYNQIIVSKDGQRIYLGLGTPEHVAEGLADQIWTYDAETWQRVSALTPPIHPKSFALSRDEQRLYALNRRDQKLSAIDVRNGREHVILPSLGGIPDLVIGEP